jgi:molybdopterin molybdotransferase
MPDAKPPMTGFEEALHLVLSMVPRLAEEEVELFEAAGRVLAEEVVSTINSPSADAALKDGYAVRSSDLNDAKPGHEVELALIGVQTAGGRLEAPALTPGTTVRVTTGAPLPRGAQAVLAREYAREEQGRVFCHNDAAPGRNVLPLGADIRTGQVIARPGEPLHPALIGLLASAGRQRLRVFARPRVAVIATGDEVVLPGAALALGQLYASNLIETLAWLSALGFPKVESAIVPDREKAIAQAVTHLAGTVDAFITSGGAWQSERDLVAQTLSDLGWRLVFHQVRLGPGKAAGFGLLGGRPFFLLPGGPPSFEAALLTLALPGLMAMAGWRGPIFPVLWARLTQGLDGDEDWTQVVHVELIAEEGGWAAVPLKEASRLSSMARKAGLVLIPEGTARLEAGQKVRVQVVAPLPA